LVSIDNKAYGTVRVGSKSDGHCFIIRFDENGVEFIAETSPNDSVEAGKQFNAGVFDSDGNYW
jgi:hypothetical protein